MMGPWKSGHGGCGHDGRAGSLEKWAWRVWS